MTSWFEKLESKTSVEIQFKLCQNREFFLLLFVYKFRTPLALFYFNEVHFAYQKNLLFVFGLLIKVTLALPLYVAQFMAVQWVNLVFDIFSVFLCLCFLMF